MGVRHLWNVATHNLPKHDNPYLDSGGLMKKLNTDRIVLVEGAIRFGREAYDKFKQSGLSTFTEQGRRVIAPYWKAQELIAEALACSITRATELIEGKKNLRDFYDSEGNPKKVGK